MLAGIRARNPGASVAEIRDVFERESFGEELAERVRRWRERVGR